MPTFYSGDPALTLARADVTCALGLAFSASAASADGEGPLAREAAVTSVRLTVGLQRGSLPHGTPVVRSGERGEDGGGAKSARGGAKSAWGRTWAGIGKAPVGYLKGVKCVFYRLLCPFILLPPHVLAFHEPKKKKKGEKGKSKGCHIIIVNVPKSQ